MAPKAQRWTLIAFGLAGLFISGLVIWQLVELRPAYWCILAKAGSPDQASGCAGMMLKLLEIKDHAIVILLCTLALIVVSVLVVALGVKVEADGPGGFSVDIGADKTTISDGKSEATIPTPPSVDPS